MLKKEIVLRVASVAGQSQKLVREVVDALERVVLEAVAAGRPVMLVGLGKLYVTRRGPKRARNLHTGETVIVPARNVVAFRPSDGLIQAANQAA